MSRTVVFGAALVVGLAVFFVVNATFTSLPAPSPRPSPTGSQATGVVIAVDSAGLGDVRSFTLRTADGQQRTLLIGPALENGDAFPPAHLAEHMATAQPIRVYYRPDGDALVATWIEDAVE